MARPRARFTVRTLFPTYPRRRFARLVAWHRLSAHSPRPLRSAIAIMNVVVVESPAKAKTIQKYLGPGFEVLASYGHVRDLPPKDGSVDPDDGFAMTWETYADKARQLKAIADEAKGAESLILATDPDREGEAISWHVQE